MIGWMSETLIVTSPWHLQEAQPRKVLTMLGPATDNLSPSTALPRIDLLFFYTSVYSFHFVVYGNIPLFLDQGVILTPCLVWTNGINLVSQSYQLHKIRERPAKIK